MEQIRNKELETLLERAIALGWSYKIYRDAAGTHNGWHCDERTYVKLRKYSLEGEDFSMNIDFDINNPVMSFVQNLKRHSDQFNIDEHVEKWMPQRGKGGCPDSVRTLLENAEDIDGMIYGLWKNLSDGIGIKEKEEQEA